MIPRGGVSKSEKAMQKLYPKESVSKVASAATEIYGKSFIIPNDDSSEHTQTHIHKQILLHNFIFMYQVFI